ncbi:hypothetical protein HYV79_02850 [Candidatus Woesearchaeota archaeon]|nr:hypothetical protein [Candidatus Woesearchaeota archaeon]
MVLKKSKYNYLYVSIIILIALAGIFVMNSVLSPTGLQVAMSPTLTAQCTDTDGGKNYDIKGVVSGVIDRFDHPDFCIANPGFLWDGHIVSDRGKEVSSCAGDNCYLIENFCPPNYWENTGQYIHEGYKCQYGCENGECRTEPIVCTDTDNGENYDIAGETTGVVAWWDPIPKNVKPHKDTCTTLCSGSVGSYASNEGPCLIEYYCSAHPNKGEDQIFAAFKVKQCENGCENGECKSQPKLICNQLQSMDECLDSHTCYWDQQTNSCTDTQTCSESDNGKDLEVQGHTFGFRTICANEQDCRIRTGGLDACTNKNTLREHYCQGNNIVIEDLTCPDACKNGACVKDIKSKCSDKDYNSCRESGSNCYWNWDKKTCQKDNICNDSDNGEAFEVKGTTTGVKLGCISEWDCKLIDTETDSCVGKDLKEYLCQDNKLAVKTKYCTWGCENSACKPEPKTCQDSDGGSNPEIKGTTSWTDESGATKQHTDYCEEIEGVKYVQEFYCTERNFKNVGSWKLIKCEHGCKDGICLLPEVGFQAPPKLQVSVTPISDDTPAQVTPTQILPAQTPKQKRICCVDLKTEGYYIPPASNYVCNEPFKVEELHEKENCGDLINRLLQKSKCDNPYSEGYPCEINDQKGYCGYTDAFKKDKLSCYIQLDGCQRWGYLCQKEGMSGDCDYTDIANNDLRLHCKISRSTPGCRGGSDEGNKCKTESGEDGICNRKAVIEVRLSTYARPLFDLRGRGLSYTINCEEKPLKYSIDETLDLLRSLSYKWPSEQDRRNAEILRELILSGEIEFSGTLSSLDEFLKMPDCYNSGDLCKNRGVTGMCDFISRNDPSTGLFCNTELPEENLVCLGKNENDACIIEGKPGNCYKFPKVNIISPVYGFDITSDIACSTKPIVINEPDLNKFLNMMNLWIVEQTS